MCAKYRILRGQAISYKNSTGSDANDCPRPFVVEASSLHRIPGRLEAGNVYLAPGDREVLVSGDVLSIDGLPQGPERHMPIDALFRSLGESRGKRVIGIIFSGMGSDGTLGLRAIKDAGGITFAQEP